MLRHPRFKEQRDQGFTLIELLVVIIIIGILAAIAIPVFLNQRKKGVDASLKSDLKNAAITEETWITDNPTSTGTQTKADFTALGFKASPGNVIFASLNPTQGGYCFLAYNINASDKYNDAVYALMGYDSTLGGILPYSAARATGGSGTMPTAGSCGSGRTAVTTIS